MKVDAGLAKDLSLLSEEQKGALKEPESQREAWEICFGEGDRLDINTTFSLTPEEIEELKRPENNLKAWMIFGKFTAGADDMDKLRAVYALAKEMLLDLSSLETAPNTDELWRYQPRVLAKLASSRRATSDYLEVKGMGLREEGE